MRTTTLVVLSLLCFMTACTEGELSTALPDGGAPDDAMGSDEDTLDQLLQGGSAERGYRSAGWIWDARTGFRCSAVLIAPNVVATAAHCFDATFRDSVAHRGAAAVFEERSYGIAALQSHPTYSNGRATHDVAVVYLTSNVPGIPPARLGSYRAPGCNLKMVAYGPDSDLGPYITGRRLSAFVCSTAVTDSITLRPAARGGAYACTGDSGGGVYVTDGSETLLAGIIVQGENARSGGGRCADGWMLAASVTTNYDFLAEARRRGPSFLGR